MLRATAGKQMSFAAALLALVVLCAQTAFVTHDHEHDHDHDSQISEPCLICSNHAEHADNTDLTGPESIGFAASFALVRWPIAAAAGIITASQARAPPLA